MRTEYDNKGSILGLHQPLEFEAESDKIALDIPKEGIAVKGWKITPLVPPVVSSWQVVATCWCPIYVCDTAPPHWLQPQVTKKQVDNFREGKLTPCCQLKAEVTGRRKKIPVLNHQVLLKGAKESYNYFTLELPVRGIVYTILKYQYAPVIETSWFLLLHA